MGKDFDSVLGTGQKVYFNVGSNQGVKVGDYFRAVRSYAGDLGGSGGFAFVQGFRQ